MAPIRANGVFIFWPTFKVAKMIYSSIAPSRNAIYWLSTYQVHSSRLCVMKWERQWVEQSRAFGDRIRVHRKALDISQEKLGERSGLHRTYIGHLERGEVNPSLLNILRVAAALDVDAGDLVKGLALKLGKNR
jgi:DNA-binding XRE family transcriptional regulator